MTITAVIPARYGSSRLPGKPLAMIGDAPVIEYVWRRVSAVVPDTIIATDSDEIVRAATGFGARAVITSTDITTGTLRCIEAYYHAGGCSDVLLNVQGDEPFISTATIEAVVSRLSMPDTPDIATAATRFDPAEGYEQLADPNRVKVVTDRRLRALYFSRAVLPSIHAGHPGNYPYLIHHGIYAFRTQIIGEIASLGPCALAEAEKLEQLAWLNAGYSIGVTVVGDVPLAIDTPADLARANDLMSGRI
ncbi:MAG: 3-deoxy-manno-octulosonate cytidylyltransferase [Paramuribaculum sp.]|nr:3-deoxy-manno-octulosonate cytidylyltransferase [Paramuribaculum sp.]